MRRLLITMLLAFPPVCRADASEAEQRYFRQQIEPILVGHCLECHADHGQGGLDLRSRDTALTGGESGVVIVPGKPAESLLYEYVAAGEMPPKQALDADQVAALEQWIRAGAVYPPTPIDPLAMTTDRRAGYDWWSLQPLSRADVPAAPAPWNGNPIDRFVHAGLVDAGLQPAPPADPAKLIRRATYDLIGLPPTPERVQAFVAACRAETGESNVVGDHAYAGLIDELLQSQHYGEQWGRHWLDVVRFGESNGFERNVIHLNVWPFRDYVIRSLNDDKPFDQLVLEHLAGDSIDPDEPAVAVGTAFLVCGPYDNVGNQDKDAAAQIRADTIDEMIRATSEAFLGMTVGCSRCHDHKFDPISQRDYYALYATFAGVTHGERSLRRQQPRPGPADQTPAPAASNGSDRQLRPAVNAKVNTETFDPVTARYVRFTILATNSSEPCIDELEIYASPRDGDAPVNVALAGTATSAGDFAGNPKHQLIHINDGQHGNDRSWISNTDGRGWVQIELAQPAVIERVVWGRDRTEQFADRVATEYRIDVAVEPGQWHAVASSEDRRPFDPASRDQDTPKWWVGKFKQDNGPFHVFIGGSPRRQGDEVTAASLTMLDRACGDYQLAADAPERERRRRLAEWIVDDQNPLTPRVLVNRIWHYHFGAGIVNTPSDFGFLGDRPSHPQLLDWLALELKKHDWRLKPLHRQIMLSQTYRQSSDYRADAARRDGDSRLLWRFPPQRLSGEEIRDTSLSIAGVLDETMGGPGFRLFRYVQDNVATYHPLDKHGPDTYRRAVYHHNARAMQIDLMSEFDKPDCAFATPRRTSTTTPLQALTMMNHSFTVDMAQALAARLEREAAGTHQQIERAYWLAYSREPELDELEIAAKFIGQQGLQAFCRALLNSNELIYVE